MWHVIVDFIAHPNLTDTDIESAFDLVDELYYWPDADRETPTTAIFYVRGETAVEATRHGMEVFTRTFAGYDVEIVATETITADAAHARYEAGVQSLR
ncbi:hypothetical protein P8A24_03045 [Arcanobacterium wilhelmae]|uniref:hypothetical protein n=1 Tax=Arcanobacterium wilhelmae TaxID=1803177 RepID=UPI002414F3B4|nr:hypothetical protein [Arcanobacterium wilhelmae]WFN90847.1 hypothetical protein P8A24_03045 [Arcanobacterium wilhelmae]